MNDTLDYLLKYLDVFLLILVRVTAVFLISPVFGRKNTPALFKIGFGLLITFIILPTVDVSNVKKYNDIFQFSIVVLNEFLVGLLLGFITYVVFSALYIAGQLIDIQIGFGMVSVMDPQNNIQMPVTANFLDIIALLTFLLMNGHHMLISGVFYSYKVLPIGAASINNALSSDVVKIFSDMFMIGFKIAAPIIAAIFITDLVLGILAKTVPQMNVFIVGMPLKVAIGLMALVVMIPVFLIVMDSIMNGMYSDLGTVIKDMVPK